MKRFQGIKANWRVVGLPNRNKVWKGVGRKAISLDLDPGKYVFVVSHFDSSGANNFKYREEFYHEVTPELWRELCNMRPTIAKPIHTTQGLVYRCGFIGCNDEHTTRMSAVMHEAEHQGVDLFEQPEKYDDVAAATSEYAEKKRGKVGRPKKPAQV